MYLDLLQSWRQLVSSLLHIRDLHNYTFKIMKTGREVLITHVPGNRYLPGTWPLRWSTRTESASHDVYRFGQSLHHQRAWLGEVNLYGNLGDNPFVKRGRTSHPQRIHLS